MFRRKKKIYVEILYPSSELELRKYKITDGNKVKIDKDNTISFKPSELYPFKRGFLRRGKKIIVSSTTLTPITWDESQKNLSKMQLWLTKKEHKTWIEVQNAKSKVKEKPFSSLTLTAIISMLGIILFLAILTANKIGVFR